MMQRLLKKLSKILKTIRNLKVWCTLGFHAWENRNWKLLTTNNKTDKINVVVCRRCKKVLILGKMFPPWR